MVPVASQYLHEPGNQWPFIPSLFISPWSTNPFPLHLGHLMIFLSNIPLILVHNRLVYINCGIIWQIFVFKYLQWRVMPNRHMCVKPEFCRCSPRPEPDAHFICPICHWPRSQRPLFLCPLRVSFPSFTQSTKFCNYVRIPFSCRARDSAPHSRSVISMATAFGSASRCRG